MFSSKDLFQMLPEIQVRICSPTWMFPVVGSEFAGSNVDHGMLTSA